MVVTPPSLFFEICIQMSFRHILCSMNSNISSKIATRSSTNKQYGITDPSQTTQYTQNTPDTNKHNA